MKVYGITALDEFLDDFVVYRNLEPLDPRLPRLADVREELGLPPGQVPRKADKDYARAIAHLLETAQALTHPGVRLARVLYLGDTRLLDSTAFRNLKAQMGQPGWAFIASEDRTAAKTVGREGDLFVANRWSAVADFLDFLEGQEFPLDEATAVVVDMDKTAIGARGRNDQVIDQARVAAVRQTVEGTLGDEFRAAEFEAAYSTLNQPPYHPFTADNQDYLAYICLMISAGLYDLPTLLKELDAGRIETFAQFITLMEGRMPGAGDEGVAEIHSQVWGNFQQGDPTPFKTFRRNEYLATVARMGHLRSPAGTGELLEKAIVVTQEIREAALYLRGRGALLFGLTDKPDEASLPSPELVAEGFLPIHRTQTHAVGEPVHL